MTSTLRFPKGLYGVTPEWDDTDRLLAAIKQAVRGGMVALQWRRKATNVQDDLAQVRRVRECCDALRVPFIVNDDWRLAAMVDADGVHLGRDDGSITQARLALGSEKIIGYSCYNDIGMAQQAIAAGADYVAFGSMYPSLIKPDAVRASLDVIRDAHQLVTTPGTLAAGDKRIAVVAIGGITPDNAAAVIKAGADSIALISGLFDAPDIQAAATRCQALFH